MRSPRSMKDTCGLGYNKNSSYIEEGESSKSGKQTNEKSKPTWHL